MMAPTIMQTATMMAMPLELKPPVALVICRDFRAQDYCIISKQLATSSRQQNN